MFKPLTVVDWLGKEAKKLLGEVEKEAPVIESEIDEEMKKLAEEAIAKTHAEGVKVGEKFLSDFETEFKKLGLELTDASLSALATLKTELENVKIATATSSPAGTAADPGSEAPAIQTAPAEAPAPVEAPAAVLVASIVPSKAQLSFSMANPSPQGLAFQVLGPDGANPTNPLVVLASDLPGVATVDINGIVTPVAIGEAKITITAADGGGASAVVVVSVGA